MASGRRIEPSPGDALVHRNTPSPVVRRVRQRLGVMLAVLVVAAAVAGAALATLVVRREATAAIATMAVLLTLPLVVAAAIVVERRALRREARRTTVGPTTAPAPATPTPAGGNGADWIEEPAAGVVPMSVRGQADLLEEGLHWRRSRGGG